MFNNVFFRVSCCLLNNVEKYGRAKQATDDNVIWRRKGPICMRGNWDKNTDTLIILNTYCFSTTTVFMRTRFHMTFYVRFLSFFPLKEEKCIKEFVFFK